MSRSHIIVETPKNHNGPRRRWRLHLPSVSEPGFYRQVTSFNAFFNSVRQRNWKNAIRRGVGTPDGDWTLYGATHESEYNMTGLPDVDLPIVDVHSIWDFYKIIGYDYKKRAWK